MKLRIVILLAVVLTIGCSQNRKPKANPAIPPTFIRQNQKFESNAQLFLGTSNRKLKLSLLEVMHKKVGENAKISDFYCQLKPGQAIIAEYDSELRRTFSMADVDQPLDLMFVNSNKMIVEIAHNLRAYSTEKFSTFEYAQYIIVSPAGFCSENNIAEGDFIDFGQRKTNGISDLETDSAGLSN